MVDLGVATDDGIVDRRAASSSALMNEVTTVYADTVRFLESLRARSVLDPPSSATVPIIHSALTSS